MREEHGVGLSGEVYETPCHLQPVFAEYNEGEFPIAMDLCRRHICLPVYVTMTEQDAHSVLVALEETLSALKGNPS
jgi:dTDP-4-amino-4,6-dideoxygalactose transaminase